METSPLDTLAHADFAPTAMRAVKDIAFGSIAGMVSKVFEHPFDLTKVRLQSQVLDSTARFSGPVDCLRQTWTNEGVRGLYRVSLPLLEKVHTLAKCFPFLIYLQGLPAPVVGAMAENATIFLSYTQLQNAIRWTTAQPLSQELSLPQLALAGAGAGAITSFILYVHPPSGTLF